MTYNFIYSNKYFEKDEMVKHSYLRNDGICCWRYFTMVPAHAFLCVLVLFYFWLDSLAPRGGTTINNHSNHGDFTVVMGLT
jgi:hypothetical protein